MKIRLPKSFSDLTLLQWKLLHTSKDDKACLLALCSSLTPTNIKKIPKKALRVAYDHLQTLRATEDRGTHVTRITVKGKEYAFVNDWDSFTLGEYIDMEMYCKDVAENCTKIMSLLYRKIKREESGMYWLEAYTAKEDDSVFESMPASIFGGALLFFSTTRKRLLKTTKLSLAKVQQEVASQKSGGGILPSTNLQEKTSSRWTQLRNKVLELRSRI